MGQYRRYSEEPKTIDALVFHGGIGNRRFGNITMNEFINALKANGWREAHNAHIYQRLVERGPEFGIYTPNEFARALRNGFTQPAERGASMRVCCGNTCWVIYQGNEIITLRHASAK
jgi:hypothetical protein